MPQDYNVTVRITDVLRRAGVEGLSAQHVVLLEEVEGARVLPIWVGPAEATALALALTGEELPRPGAYQFTQALLQRAGSGLREVLVNRLVEGVFYAEAVLDNGETVDARPSDALNLALVTGAPVRVSAEVLDQLDDTVAREVEQARSSAEDARTIVAEFQRRLAEDLAAAGRR